MGVGGGGGGFCDGLASHKERVVKYLVASCYENWYKLLPGGPLGLYADLTFTYFFNLQSMWVGVVHHVVGEHEWVDGQCSHGPLTASEDGKTYLAKGSKSAEAVRKVVFDAKWLNSLIHYVTFR